MLDSPVQVIDGSERMTNARVRTDMVRPELQRSLKCGYRLGPSALAGKGVAEVKVKMEGSGSGAEL